MINSNGNIILFGLGKSEYTPAQHFIEKFNSLGSVLFIVDNNPELCGEFCGISVRPQSALAPYIEDKTVTIVITAIWSCPEIEAALLEMGFDADQIVTAMGDADFYSSYVSHFYQTKYTLSATPVRINMELSRNCNCRCIYCPSHGVDAPIKPDSGFMSWEVLKEVTRQIAKVPSITDGYFCGKGETYLHPQWYEMIEYMITNSHVRNLTIYSNGMLLNKETVHKLSKLPLDSLKLEISIDGETPEENDLYRIGSNYKVLKENINYAVQALSGKNVVFYIMNTHPVTEDFLVQNGHTLMRYLPVPNFIRDDFPDKIIKGCRMTMMWSSNSCYQANGVTLRSQRVKREGVLFPPCVNPFHDIDVTFSGDILRYSCDTKAYKAPVTNVLDGDFIKTWSEGDTMKAVRQIFMAGKIPAFCRDCEMGPVSELELEAAVRTE